MQMGRSGRRTFAAYTYALSFFVSLHGFLLIYINSSLLSRFFSDAKVGAIFALGNCVAVIAFLIVPYFLKAVGNYFLITAAITAEIGASIGLAFSGSAYFIVPLLIAHLTIVAFLYYFLDIFVESVSNEDHMGDARGIYLTVTNAALVMAPFAVGFLLGETTEYEHVYLIAAIVLMFPLVLLPMKFRSFRDPLYAHTPLMKAVANLWKRRDLYRAAASNFLLYFFYSAMVVYLPLYLHADIGFSWEEIGLLFTIMLLPFVLFELPLGHLADTRWGEKEILSAGFIIIALFTASFAFIQTAHFALWAIVLFASRIGASMVEIMCETYFFKKVRRDDADSLSFFRLVQPLAYMIGPAVSAVFVVILPEFRFLFVAIAVIVLLGLHYSLALRDTR